MSYSGSFSAQGNYAGHNTHEDKVGSHQSKNPHTERYGASTSRVQKHPPWLKGKEIGMYYKNLSMNKPKRMPPYHNIGLPIHLQDNIEELLKRSEGYYNTLYNRRARTQYTNTALENKYVHIHDSQFKRQFLNTVSGNILENLAKASLVQSKLDKDNDLDEKLLSEYKAKQSLKEYENMMEFRTKLPSYQKGPEILQLLRENQVIVISGETGCGKTTQIAQYILDDHIEQGCGSIIKIICTQPRRISAISVAERVAAERVETLGKSVGFHIRLEKVLPRDKGGILFCTTGVLLQFMQSDPALKGFSHIILDEIHERSTDSDFVIALLKLIIPKRPDLKVILMSATLNSEVFSKYYNDCPMIHIPGFTYPVEEFYLEDILLFTGFEFRGTKVTQDYNRFTKKSKQISEAEDPYLPQIIAEKTYPKHIIDQLKNPESEKLNFEFIEQLIRYICRTQGPGAILIFLPGMMDIRNLQQTLESSGRYPESQYVIYPVHSLLPTIDQKLIFKEPPKGIRKIIIATSIAETSITIEDVVYVIDSGKTKFGNFDTRCNVQTLDVEWISLANAKQRRGRAGRVKPGVCYHLYSREKEMTFKKYPIPEMQRTRLEEVILRIKILQLGKTTSFLSYVINPPDRKAIELSLELLGTLNALDDEENLTPLGYHLAKLPVDPRIGKMMIWAALFSCVEPVFAIAASLNFKQAFYCPLGKEEIVKQKKRELNRGEYSDHIAFAEALKRFESSYSVRIAGHFCRNYFLSFNTMKLLSEMKSQFAQHLYEMNFLDSQNPSDINSNRNSDNVKLVKMIVCAGLYPNIAVITNVARNGTSAITAQDEHVTIHPSSVNDKITVFPSDFITYYRKQRTTATYIHDTTCVTGPILLMTAPYIMSKTQNRYRCIITIPKFSHMFTCEKRTTELLQRLQQQFNDMLKYKITHPGTVTWNSYEGDLLKTVIHVVCLENKT